jgi:hypothetical protein
MFSVNLLVVPAVVLVGLVAVVVLVGVALLLSLGQAIDQVVGGLVGDVGQQPVHQGTVPLQLVLNGVTTFNINAIIVIHYNTLWFISRNFYVELMLSYIG